MGFAGDKRGQSIQLGAILLFGFLILALVGYQTVIVPQQNKAVEFQHSQDVQSDLVGVRDGILNAAFNGENPLRDVELGTSYPVRLIAMNPAPVTGTLDTTAERSLSVSGVTDPCPGNETTRSVRYHGGYNFYNTAPTIRIENTVMAREFDNEEITSVEQQLVNGERINLVPIRLAFRESDTETISVEMTPGNVRSTTVSNPTVKVPTHLNNSTWVELLAGEVDPSNVAVLNQSDGDPDNDVLQLTLNGDYTVNCRPVAIGGDPPSGVRNSVSGGGGGTSINPSGAGEVTLSGTNFDEGQDEIELTFTNNDDETRTFNRARIPFYYEVNKQEEVDALTLKSNPSADEFVVGDPYEPVNQSISIDPGNSTTITLNSTNDMKKNDFFEFDVEFDDGRVSRYYIDTNADSGSGSVVLDSSSSTGSHNASFVFTLNNTGGSDVTISKIAVNDTTNSSATQVNNSAPGDDIEFERTDGGSGKVTNIIEIGGPAESLSPDATIKGGNTADFILQYFKDDSGTKLDMTGESVTITVFFSDGSSNEYALTD